MADQVTEEQLAEMKEMFGVFDKDLDGYIRTEEMGALIRAMGQNPTDAEVQECILEFDPDGSGEFNLPTFLLVMAKSLEHKDTMEDMEEAFRVFDKEGNGLISIDVLQHVMLNMGETMTPEQTAEMIKTAEVDQDGNIIYGDFLKLLMEKDGPTS